jgi:hypothetical protein
MAPYENNWQLITDKLRGQATGAEIGTQMALSRRYKSD